MTGTAGDIGSRVNPDKHLPCPNKAGFSGARLILVNVMNDTSNLKMTWAPGTSDCIDKFLGKATAITLFITMPNEDVYETEVITPKGWSAETLMTTLGQAIGAICHGVPFLIHFQKMELILVN